MALFCPVVIDTHTRTHTQRERETQRDRGIGRQRCAFKIRILMDFRIMCTVMKSLEIAYLLHHVMVYGDLGSCFYSLATCDVIHK